MRPYYYNGIGMMVSSSLLLWLSFILIVDVSESMVISRRGIIEEGFTRVTSSVIVGIATSGSDNQLDSYVNNDKSERLNSLLVDEEEQGSSTYNSSSSLTIPLKWIPDIQAYVLYYTVGGDSFGAIVDTGSPFLTVPSYCDETKWGCYRPESSIPSGLSPSIEQFDNNMGEVEWRTAPFAFVTQLRKHNNNNNNSGNQYYGTMTNNDILPKAVTFGVLSESLMDGPGGVFFGLVKKTDARIRPSFLSQMNQNICSFQIDLSSQDQKSLSLSTRPLLSKEGSYYIPLMNDLHSRYGDPTFHYTARASSITVNGNPLFDPYAKDKPIYVIFDTGVTGMAMSKDLFDLRYIFARRNKEKNLWGNVQISFPTKQNDAKQTNKTSTKPTITTTTLSAIKPITTPIDEIPWPRFKNQAHIIVIGLSFFDGNKLTFDIDERKFWLETPPSESTTATVKSTTLQHE